LRVASGALKHRISHSFLVSPRRRALIVFGLLLEPVTLWLRGLPIGGWLVVRCRKGHLFRTLWIPSVSVKALRLGFLRIQRCPVGRHWSIVMPVRESELGAGDRRLAGWYPSSCIP
jgi:hypothetical protein